jgi:FkbM family methyltransferase
MGMKAFLNTCSRTVKSEEVKVVLDVGAFNCMEAIEISKAFPGARIYSFECHPESVKRCRENSKEYSNITVVNKAVTNYDGITKFFPTDPEKTVTTWPDGNPGASSLFRASGTYDHIEKYVQYEVEVECTRLDTWAAQNQINQIDLIWMDLQGAELLALEGLGGFLQGVKVIHTEVEINPMYAEQALFKDIDPFLQKNNFVRVWGNIEAQFGTDVIYIKRILDWRKRQEVCC